MLSVSRLRPIFTPFGKHYHTRHERVKPSAENKESGCVKNKHHDTKCKDRLKGSFDLTYLRFLEPCTRCVFWKNWHYHICRTGNEAWTLSRLVQLTERKSEITAILDKKLNFWWIPKPRTHLKQNLQNLPLLVVWCILTVLIHNIEFSKAKRTCSAKYPNAFFKSSPMTHTHPIKHPQGSFVLF